MLAAWIGLISNVLLSGVKIVVGSLFRSPSLVADGINNGADILSSIVSLGSMKASIQPADQEHPYGHGKIEVVASFLISIFLGFASVVMIKESIEALMNPIQSFHGITLIVALVSFIWKLILYIYTIKIGNAQKSKGLVAIAYDHFADMIASLAVVTGIGFAWLCEKLDIPGGYLGDPVAGIIVSLIILWIAYKMGNDSFHILIERNVSRAVLEAYQDCILEVPQVKRIDRIRARDHGRYVLIDVRVGVPGELTVKEGHDIAKAIKQRLMQEFQEVKEVLVHVNPWFDDD
jgi:cation diffusion facilitator family transporter